MTIKELTLGELHTMYWNDMKDILRAIYLADMKDIARQAYSLPSVSRHAFVDKTIKESTWYASLPYLRVVVAISANIQAHVSGPIECLAYQAMYDDIQELLDYNAAKDAE